jgi:hypothetical protein
MAGSRSAIAASASPRSRSPGTVPATSRACSISVAARAGSMAPSRSAIAASARLRCQPAMVSGVAEYTVLTAVACQGADVRRCPVCSVLGRTWGARGGGERIMPELAQVRLYGPEERDSLARSVLAPPSRIRTCAHGSRVYFRYQQERGLRCWRGVRMGRGKSSSSASPSAAIDSHDPEVIRCTKDHTCMSRTWHGCDAG